MHATQARATLEFRKTAETFKAGAKTLAQQYFTSPEIFAQEREKIFSNQWILVGHQSQIPQAGDYFFAEPAGENLIVVRDKRGAIHGFYNVCRHRGADFSKRRNAHAQRFSVLITRGRMRSMGD